jgi:hypothetical protein
MDLDITAVRAKLIRSQENAQNVRNEILAYNQRYPYSLIDKVNPDSTRYSLILRINEPAPFQRWTLIFADAVNNLRTALDYLVYAVAVCESRKSPPPHELRLRFPLTDSEDAFDEEVRTRRLGDLSNTTVSKIKSLQPYNRPHDKLPPLLGVLRDLNNTDKHRLLRLTFGAMMQANIGFVGEVPQDGRQWKVIPNPGEIEDGTEIMAMVCDRSSPGMKFDRKIVDVSVAVWHEKRDPAGAADTARTDLLALYSALASEVRTVIYEISKII